MVAVPVWGWTLVSALSLLSATGWAAVIRLLHDDDTYRKAQR